MSEFSTLIYDSRCLILIDIFRYKEKDRVEIWDATTGKHISTIPHVNDVSNAIVSAKNDLKIVYKMENGFIKKEYSSEVRRLFYRLS